MTNLYKYCLNVDSSSSNSSSSYSKSVCVCVCDHNPNDRSDRSFSVGPAAVWAIFRSNQWSTTGLSKAVVCTVLSMEKCI